MTEGDTASFIKAVKQTPLRDLPWRQPEADGSFDSYKIWISEIMLQQTQVPRVIPKYQQFLSAFPDVKLLARSRFSDVLAIWSGLGYNRRAKYVLDAAKLITERYGGKMPITVQDLQTLPGVGHNTAAAIRVYTHNQPEIFIETNIRTVFIHYFFNEESGVDDKQLIPLLEQTLNHANPRVWYWQLMDYGTYLKAQRGNLSQRSKHYVKQSAFQGSRRQLRAAILRSLLEGKQSLAQLKTLHQDDRVEVVLAILQKEGLISRHNKYFSLA